MEKKRISTSRRNFFIINTITLLISLSGEMVYSVLPFYLVSVIGASYIVVGIIEGFLELLSNFVKIFAGYISDFKQKKYLLIYSFVLSLIGRIYLSFSKNWQDVLIYTAFESISDGTRAPSIDILLATKRKFLGRIYGINRVFENVGGLIGIFLALLFSLFFLGDLKSYNIYFFLTAIPIIACIFFALFLKEKLKRRRRIKAISLEILYPEYLLLFFVLSFANFGYSFYILKVYQSLDSQYKTIGIYMFFYFLLAVVSYFTGRFFDYIGEKRFIYVSVLLFFSSHLLMIYLPIVGFVNFAVADAFMDIGVWAILGQKIKFRRGFVFGMYHFTIGISSLLASLMAGYLWDNFNSEAPFLMGVFASVVAFFIIKYILR